jgi:glycosyltransferase involved in cell wall biosynthesis
MREQHISIVTTALPHRVSYLERLVVQSPWIRAYQWILCGPSSFEMASFVGSVRATWITSTEPMGTCRNLCNEAAKGDVIIQIDDDDWQHPNRLVKQCKALMREKTELVGSSWLYCLHAPTKTASRISFWDVPNALPGATLAYYKSAWQRNPYQPIQAEDGPFVQAFTREKTAYDMKDPKLLVYLRHGAHKPEQRDWWREARSREMRKSVADRMKERIANPSKRLMAPPVVTDWDRALDHEEEAATVYVQHLMGDRDFEAFCQ